MLFTKPAFSLLVLASSVVGNQEPSQYYATLGKYGTFQLEISADDGTMKWTSDLSNLGELAASLNITAGIPSLNYHLHQSWNLSTDFATGGTACGLPNLGNHYDPYFACGPASGQSDTTCNALGRPRNATRYACTKANFALGNYNECEVGDLSGKDGALIVTPDGKAIGSTVVPDPLAALDNEFVAARTVNPPNKWSAIVFHNGSPRVLCGKIFAGALPPQCGVEFILVDADKDKQLGPLKAEECLAPFRYSIEAVPTAGCPATSSARMILSKGTSIVQDRNEGSGPFTLFGDSAGDYNGRPMVEGKFTLKAQLFAERRQQGLVVERSFDFSVVDCSRRLRGTA